MADHMTEWLGAYHDGELQGARLRQVEGHLAACAACRAELDGIRNLSALLQEPALDAALLQTERFAANLALSLPRRPARPPSRRALQIGWWLVPVGLLGLWVFIEITFSLSAAVTLAADSGLFGGSLAWLQGAPLQMAWFSTAMDLFGEQLGPAGSGILGVLNEGHVFVAQLLGGLIPQAILAAAYMGWLLSWWLRNSDSHSPLEKET